MGMPGNVGMPGQVGMPGHVGYARTGGGYDI